MNLKRKQVFELVKRGKTKDDIYIALIEDGYSRKEALGVLLTVPSFDRMKKYSWFNHVQGILLALISIGGVYFQQYYLVPVYVIMSYLVFSYRINYYYWLVIISIFAFVAIISTFTLNGSYMVPERISLSIFLAAILVLSIILVRCFNHQPLTRSIVYETESGQMRSYKEYFFEE